MTTTVTIDSTAAEAIIADYINENAEVIARQIVIDAKGSVYCEDNSK